MCVCVYVCCVFMCNVYVRVCKDIECVAIFKTLRRDFFYSYIRKKSTHYSSIPELQYPRFHDTLHTHERECEFFVNDSHTHTRVSCPSVRLASPKKIIASHIFVPFFFVSFDFTFFYVRPTVLPLKRASISSVFCCLFCRYITPYVRSFCIILSSVDMTLYI